MKSFSKNSFKLPFLIARRYLFAQKSHNVINIVSAISSVGMAVGTAALIIILSVYNGFDSLVKTMFSTVEPDLLVVPAQGKYFIPEGEAWDAIYDDARVKSICSVLQENVFVSYEDRQDVVVAKGVDEVYLEESTLSEYIIDGEFKLSGRGMNFAAVGRGFSRSMGMNVRFLTPIHLYYPEKNARISVINPMSALNSESLWPGCEFAVNADIDNSLMIVGRDLMARLLGLQDDQVSAVELRLEDGISERESRKAQKEISALLGPQFKVLDRAQQNPSLYKMLRYEKMAVYMIMLFVVLILGFSIFGSLSMLIIDKRPDIDTLSAMGMSGQGIRRCFTLEGWLITLIGLVSGLVLGIIFCLLQYRFGFISMPGNFLVEAYPVVLDWRDVVLSALSITLAGYLIALIPASRIKTGHPIN